MNRWLILLLVLLIVGCEGILVEPEVQWVCKVKPDWDGPLQVPGASVIVDGVAYVP